VVFNKMEDIWNRKNRIDGVAKFSCKYSLEHKNTKNAIKTKQRNAAAMTTTPTTLSGHFTQLLL
jgi:hypothetical protein